MNRKKNQRVFVLRVNAFTTVIADKLANTNCVSKHLVPEKWRLLWWTPTNLILVIGTASLAKFQQKQSAQMKKNCSGSALRLIKPSISRLMLLSRAILVHYQPIGYLALVESRPRRQNIPTVGSFLVNYADNLKKVMRWHGKFRKN